MFSRPTRRCTAVVLAAVLFVSGVHIADAHPSGTESVPRPSGSTAHLHPLETPGKDSGHSHTDAGDREAAERAIAEGLRQLESLTAGMPASLQEKPLNSPEVQHWLREQGRYPAVVPYFNTLACGYSVVSFLIQTGWPAAKVWRIVKSFGGIKAFAKIVYEFLKHGSFPPAATDELIELLEALTGIGDILDNCA